VVVLKVGVDLVVEVGFVDVLSVLLVVPTNEVVLVVLLVVVPVVFDVVLLPLPPATAPEA
jgi:hypothetical protein